MIEHQTPPQWATKLLNRICSPNLLEEIQGDLLEEYQYQLEKHGPAKANWDYITTVFGFIRLSIFRKKKLHNPSSIANTIMLRNYLTTAVRNIIRHPSYSSINLAGLTLGLACSMLIFQFVTVERGADRFHEQVDHTYRVALERQLNGKIDETFSQIFYGAGEALTNEIPEVKGYTRVLADFFQEGPTLSRAYNDDEDGFKDVRSIIVDSTFLSIFSFPLVQGDPGTALRLPDAILLTESMAQKMFSSTDPLGQIIQYGSGALSSQDFVVTGILKDAPENSHIQFDVVIPMRNFFGNISKEDLAGLAWRQSQYTTYITTKPGANIERIEKVMNDILARNVQQDNFKLTTTLQPMKSVYFDRETDLGLTGFGSVQTTTRTGNYWIVYFLMIIGIMTLAIAFISYVNLSTLRSLDRAKEVGVRKVIGAGKADLKWQFFLEATLMNFTALALAFGLLLLLKPLIYSYVHLDLGLSSMISKPFLLLFGGVFLAGVLLSGSYPAFILSSFQPIMAIKEKITSTSGRSNLRKALIVFQYTAVVALLVCTVIVYQQLHYMQNKDIGLEMDQLVTIRSPRFIPENTRSEDAETALKNEILALSSVMSVTFTGNQAGRGLNFSFPFQRDRVGSAEIKMAIGTGVDHNFADVYGLDLLAGEAFREGMLHDPGGGRDQNYSRVLVNETAVQMWGFSSNEEAVGQLVTSLNGRRFFIQGVLEDFNWSSVHQATQPVMLWYTKANRFMTIKVGSNDLNQSLAEIKSIYDRLFPKDVFHYEMTDAVFNEQYKEDQKFAHLFGIFSAISILIATLGILGLSSFTTTRRRKEIGIRKVLGASVHQIVKLLSKEFLLLIFIAFLLACPIAWWAMSTWLEKFAFRIDLTILPFVATGFVALLTALMTVSWKTFSAATTNPVNALKEE